MCIEDKLNNTVSDSTPIIHKSTPTIIHSHLTPSNYYDVLSHLADDDDDTTIVMSNLSSTDTSDCATATTDPSTEDEISSDDLSHIIHQLGQTQTPGEFAILDSGATAHFIIQGANVLNQNQQPILFKSNSQMAASSNQHIPATSTSHGSLSP